MFLNDVYSSLNIARDQERHPPLPVLTVKMGKFKIKLDEGGFYQCFMTLSMIMVTMMNSFLVTETL